MKKILLSAILSISSIAMGQVSFPQLDQSDVLSFETDITSKHGGKYQTEISVVAMYDGEVQFQEVIGKANASQKKIQGSAMSSAEVGFKFSVKALQEKLSDLYEQVGDP